VNRTLRIVSFVAVLAVAAGLPAAAPSGAADPKSPGATDASTTEALAALAEVEALFAAPGTARRAAGHQADTDATIALRDLSLVIDDLPADRRDQARAFYKRPTQLGGDGTLAYGVAEEAPVCGPVVCVHYVASTADAPDLTDNNVNGVPDYVDRASAILDRVHNVYVQAGYKRPRGDGSIGGGTNKVDIYLGDIDAGGLYGYCTTDENRNGAPYDRWAYCVLDDDYANIPMNTPIENLQVTAAHEYFHAVQYAYDYLEDGWYLEGTAAWVEDEMYDAVNDNRQYLRRSPLTNPRRPMDQFASDGWHYGTWIWFTYLSQRFPASRAGLPTIIRDTLRRADGTRGARNDYHSWQAISAVLRARGSSSQAEFATFSANNRRSRTTYREGAALRYPVAPLWASATITRTRNAVTGSVVLDHLSSATARLVPGRLTASNWKLRIGLDLTPTSRGSRAVIMVTAKNGRVRRIGVTLNGQGNATRTVAFSSGSVRAVEVTLVNAGGRFRCWEGTRFSCQGVPLDENQRQKLTAVAFR
jgi:hypothetical protein